MTTRELTLATVYHPEHIGNDWQRVDHPVLDPLTHGAADLGWEGDDRLVVYLCKPTQQFVLWRLEANGEYGPCAALPPNGSLTPGNVNELIRRLVAHDTRRGYDAYQDVIDQQAMAARHAETDRLAHIEQFADKLHFALARSHMPGVWATRVRNAPTRK
jgi:hypothetical protein